MNKRKGEREREREVILIPYMCPSCSVKPVYQYAHIFEKLPETRIRYLLLDQT